jgi:hypothetical protein
MGRRSFRADQVALGKIIREILVVQGRMRPTSISVGEFTVAVGFTSEVEAGDALAKLSPVLGRGGFVHPSRAGILDRRVWDPEAFGQQVPIWRAVVGAHPISEKVWGRAG